MASYVHRGLSRPTGTVPQRRLAAQVELPSGTAGDDQFGGCRTVEQSYIKNKQIGEGTYGQVRPSWCCGPALLWSLLQLAGRAASPGVAAPLRRCLV